MLQALIYHLEHTMIPRPRWSQEDSTEHVVFLHQPGQQGVDVVRCGWVRAQWWGCHKGSCLGPVLTPIMGPIYPETGSDGFAKDHVSCKEWMSGSQEIDNAPAYLIRTPCLLKALFLK